jgi:hypothetical protein
MDSDYGTFPERLIDLFDAVGPEERAYIRTLTAAEDGEYAAVSLDRFTVQPHTMGALDWSGVVVLEQRVEEDYEAASALFGGLVLQHAPSPASEVIVFWGNLAIPTIGIPARLAAEQAGELMDTGDDAWVYLPESKILVEYWHSGRITAGKVPEGEGGGPARPAVPAS